MIRMVSKQSSISHTVWPTHLNTKKNQQTVLVRLLRSSSSSSHISHWKAVLVHKDFLSEKVLGVWGRLRVDCPVGPFSYYLPLLPTFLHQHTLCAHQHTTAHTFAYLMWSQIWTCAHKYIFVSSQAPSIALRAHYAVQQFLSDIANAT